MKFEFSLLTFSIMAMGLHLKQRWRYIYISILPGNLRPHLFASYIYYCYVLNGEVT